jgi:hypothetical protein
MFPDNVKSESLIYLNNGGPMPLFPFLNKQTQHEDGS